MVNDTNREVTVKQHRASPPSAEKLAESIEVMDGVFRPDAGSIALARAAESYPGQFCDLGTGTGYLAVHLALRGRRGLAADSSPRAVECAKRNIEARDLDCEVRRSDLFSAIPQRFDLVTFNPPTNRGETENQRGRKSAVKALLPGFAHALLSKAFQVRNRGPRLAWIEDFVAEARDHLGANGVLLLNVLKTDATRLEQLGGAQIERVGESERTCVLEIRYSNTV